MKKKPIISIVVCTYNRCDVLKEALETLCNQSFSDTSWYELLVIDNNSSDNTSNVVKGLCQKNCEIKYIVEKKQGLSHARNRGYAEALGEYVAYIDDDCKVPKNWLTVAKDIIENHRPGAFGGPAYAFYNSPKPFWYKDEYGSHIPLLEPKVLEGDESIKIFGMNMCFKHSLLKEHGGFDIGLGMTGEKAAYCEETALLLDISRKSPNELIYYDPKLYVHHLVQKERMTLQWFVRSSLSIGRDAYLLMNSAKRSMQFSKKPRSQFYMGYYREIKKLMVCFAYAVLCRPRAQYPFVQNYIVENAYQPLKNLGKLREAYSQFKAADSITADK